MSQRLFISMFLPCESACLNSLKTANSFYHENHKIQKTFFVPFAPFCGYSNLLFVSNPQKFRANTEPKKDDISRAYCHGNSQNSQKRFFYFCAFCALLRLLEFSCLFPTLRNSGQIQSQIKRRNLKSILPRKFTQFAKKVSLLLCLLRPFAATRI